MRLWIFALAFLCSAMAGTGAVAQTAPVLEFPAGCRIGDDCWIFSLPDLQPGTGYRDHRCGPRTYDQHKGTDIALVDASRRNVGVYASAAGTVVGTRDGVKDNPTGGDVAPEAGKECGNGVRLYHGSGWHTQYCHLLQGSVVVQKGQTVASGDLLGLVGNSGNSEVPHLHFQVEHNRRIVDPFSGRSPAQTADCEGGTSMWSAAAATLFGPYAPTFIRHAGFAADRPNLKAIQRLGSPDTLAVDAPALILFATVYGVSAGTVIRFRITGPDGRTVLEENATVPARKARQFQYAGRRTPEGGWPAGTYSGTVTVEGAAPSGPVTLSRTTRVVLR